MSLKIYDVDPTLLRWVLMGGFEEEDHHAVPNPFTWLPELIWMLFRRAATQLDGFAHVTELVQQHAMFFMDFYESSNPLELELPGVLNDMSSIEKLVVVRCLRMDKVVPAIRNYVSETLGEYFVEPPLYALETVVDELSYDPSVPIILVLSPGADPHAELDRVAELRGMAQSKLFKLSRGQGQDVPACEMMDTGTKEGHWVFLQNCHLYADFMPRLSRMIEDYSDAAAKERLHRNYRLWLTSLPSDVFPFAILQNGVKLVQEPPKGLKSNLLQSYLSDPVADAEFFNGADMPEAWQKLLFGLNSV
ncbi:putative dynein heavy chain [Leptomonas pyrrhocoris]|uniref:Putative dynein heavy chain n=1 Tax=Leptomonas pyrrhocoris TaxID=157538 RepID=A0A0M9FRW4_LEPPY|nr:putative dynein heavy chain [Leptomonas pyrrhocoris]KPA74810.1 putative dynein heavy chain [Leptomonas pyrrhocoris]|eukprot:XP_015653249.1 putative dynein heavy chain [Leptomonas pyrrhocoris]